MVARTSRSTYHLAAFVLACIALILSTSYIGSATTFASPEDQAPEASEHTSNQLQLDLDTDEVTAGEAIEISGAGFSPGGHIEFRFGTTDVDSTNADANGEFTIALTTPTRIDTGRNELTAVDGETGRTATAALTINDTAETIGTPLVTIDPTSAYPGEAVNVTGTHFSSGPIELMFNGESLPEANAGDGGAFSTIVNIPPELQPGEYEVVAVDENDQRATAALTVLQEADEHGQAAVLELTTNTTQVQIGDTLRLRVEGPEDFLAEHSTQNDAPPLTPHSELTNTIGQRGTFVETEPQLTDSGDGYRTFEYVVPEYQPTTNVFDDVGAITHGVYFTFFIEIENAESEGDDSPGVTSNEVTVVVNGSGTDHTTEDTDRETASALTIDPEQIDLEEFVGDPDESAGIHHRIDELTPGTETHYTVNGPEHVERITQSTAANDQGVVEFTIYGQEASATSAYLGDYTTTITFNEDNGISGELTGEFAVTGQPPAGQPGDPDELEPLGIRLATTGGNHTALFVFVGLLLAAGGAIVVFTNRSRLFDTEEPV